MLDETRRRILTWHEAGHALVCLQHGMTDFRIGVRVTRRGANTVYHPNESLAALRRETDMLTAIAKVEQAVARTVAGVAALRIRRLNFSAATAWSFAGDHDRMAALAIAHVLWAGVHAERLVNRLELSMRKQFAEPAARKSLEILAAALEKGDILRGEDARQLLGDLPAMPLFAAQHQQDDIAPAERVPPKAKRIITGAAPA